jgi:adenosine deaminase
MTDAGPDYRPFLAALPKCEHHLHIEGSLSPSLLFSLSARNAIALPSAISDIAYANVAALEARYKAFTSLDDFLAYYDRASRVLIKREDFADLSYAYMQKASEDGIAHTEISFDLQTHTQRGIAVETVVKGLNDGLKKGEKEFGITFRVIMCILRHESVQSCVDHVDLALPYYQSGDIHGLGMCSTEKDQHPKKYLPVYQRAKEVGIEFLTAHAGEEGPAEYVRSALEDLGVTRIDHGVRSVEDEHVLAMLRERKTMLTVCPLSNVALRVVKHLSEVPLRKLLDAGIRASLVGHGMTNNTFNNIYP